MQKKYLLPLAIATILGGCSSKEPLAAVEATDYAMSCGALINEINLVRSQFQKEKDTINATKILTFGIFGNDNEKEILLRERAQSLQLLYTIKQSKGECKTLDSEDTKVDSSITRQTKEVKDTVKSTKKAIME